LPGGALAACACSRTFVDQAELDPFATSYESRFDTDKDKLDAIMHYPQSTECRVKRLAEYFGEDRDGECGQCDNCRDRPAETAGTPEGVRHREFGAGCVEEVTAEHVRVRFERSGPKVVHPEYLIERM
jgi:superfamily II DNA helicase RecQ